MRFTCWTMLAAAAATFSAVPAFGQSLLQQPDSVRPTVMASYDDDYYAADGATRAPSSKPAQPAGNDGASCGCNSCGCNSCDSGCGCNSCGCNDCCESCGRLGCSDWLADLSFNSGVVAFRGPLDLDDFGTHGNFGYEGGFNWGLPLLDGIGLQTGGNYVTSNDTEEDFGHRKQYFFTTGLFHRPECGCGLQGGFVIDYMQEKWDEVHTPIDLTQVRGNVSYVNGCREFGFEWSTGVRDSNTTLHFEGDETINVRAADLYTFYFRRHLDCCRGEWKAFGGYANQLGGIFGGDVAVTLSDTWALETGFSYLIPRSNNGSTNPNDLPAFESWTIGFNLVWHPCDRADHYYCDEYRPLFKAADNTTLFFNGIDD